MRDLASNVIMVLLIHSIVFSPSVRHFRLLAVRAEGQGSAGGRLHEGAHQGEAGGPGPGDRHHLLQGGVFSLALAVQRCAGEPGLSPGQD